MNVMRQKAHGFKHGQLVLSAFDGAYAEDVFLWQTILCSDCENLRIGR